MEKHQSPGPGETADADIGPENPDGHTVNPENSRWVNWIKQWQEKIGKNTQEKNSNQTVTKDDDWSKSPV